MNKMGSKQFLIIMEEFNQTKSIQKENWIITVCKPLQENTIQDTENEEANQKTVKIINPVEDL